MTFVRHARPSRNDSRPLLRVLMLGIHGAALIPDRTALEDWCLPFVAAALLGWPSGHEWRSRHRVSDVGGALDAAGLPWTIGRRRAGHHATACNVWGARRSSFVRAALIPQRPPRQHRCASPTVHCGRSDNHSVIQRQASAANDDTTDTREASISGARQPRHADY
jgi:hypothetical protein